MKKREKVPEVQVIIPWVDEHFKYIQSHKNITRREGVTAHYIHDVQRKGQVYWINRFIDSIDARDDLYINFHGADDFLLQHRMNYVRKFIEKEEYPEWVYGGHIQIYQDNYIDEIRHFPTPWDYGALKKHNYIAGGSAFIRSDIAKEMGYLRDLWGNQGADWDYWLRLGEKYEPRVYWGFVYVERLGTSTIRNKNSKLYNRTKYYVWKIERKLRKVEYPSKPVA